jgi:hypothetical protein
MKSGLSIARPTALPFYAARFVLPSTLAVAFSHHRLNKGGYEGLGILRKPYESQWAAF